MLGAAVGAAEHCELAAGTSANTALPPDQPQRPSGCPSTRQPRPVLTVVCGLSGCQQ